MGALARITGSCDSRRGRSGVFFAKAVLHARQRSRFRLNPKNVIANRNGQNGLFHLAFAGAFNRLRYRRRSFPHEIMQTPIAHIHVIKATRPANRAYLHRKPFLSISVNTLSPTSNHGALVAMRSTATVAETQRMRSPQPTDLRETKTRPEQSANATSIGTSIPNVWISRHGTNTAYE